MRIWLSRKSPSLAKSREAENSQGVIGRYRVIRRRKISIAIYSLSLSLSLCLSIIVIVSYSRIHFEIYICPSTLFISLSSFLVNVAQLLLRLLPLGIPDWTFVCLS